VGIAFRVDSSFKLAIPGLILTSTNWNFGALSQYLHPYLPLPIRIWGLIIMLSFVFTSIYWDFGA
jgi:hypothetical protein